MYDKIKRFFWCAGEAVLPKVPKWLAKAAGLDLIADMCDVGEDFYKSWVAKASEPQARAELQAVAQPLPPAQLKEIVAQVVAQLAADQPADVQQGLAQYLSQIPGATRQALKRPNDPTGTSVPATLSFKKPADVIGLLPVGLAQFKPGDRPECLHGDWELLELLGRGGQGEVWKACRIDDADWVAAFKFCTDPDTKRQLQLGHEKAIVQRVKKANLKGVVALQGYKLESSPPWLQYELVEGGDLAGFVNQWNEQPTVSRMHLVLPIVQDLAKTVGQFHRLSDPVIHRDLKPANILVQRAPRGKKIEAFLIADFGIGHIAAKKNLEQLHRAGNLGQSLGTLRYACTALYASPQQQRGEDPDVRDDVFALGVIWYQLLLRDLAKGAPTGFGWDRTLRNLGVSDAHIQLLGLCLAGEPDYRPSDAQDLYEKLMHLSTKAKPLAPPSPPPVEPTEQTKNVAVPPAANVAPVATTPIAEWKTVEPIDQSEPVPHEFAELQTHPSGAWRMLAASLRGRLHAHKGMWRDDAYAFDWVDDWTVVALCDGADSAKYARIAARIAANMALESIKKSFRGFHLSLADSDTPSKHEEVRLQSILAKAALGARYALTLEHDERGCTYRDLNTTLLLMVHTRFNDKDLVGALQVGDGAIAVYTEDEACAVLGPFDDELFPSKTCCLIDAGIDLTFGERVQIRTFKKAVRGIAVMSTGVSNDFFPEDNRLVELFNGDPIPELKMNNGGKHTPVWGLMHQEYGITRDPQDGNSLVDWLRYEKRGSSDDRTLVLIYRSEKRGDQTKSAATTSPGNVEKSQTAEGGVTPQKTGDSLWKPVFAVTETEGGQRPEPAPPIWKPVFAVAETEGGQRPEPAPPIAWVAPAAPPPKPTHKVGDIITNSLGIKFAWVPPGKSWLGGGKGKVGTTPFTLKHGVWCGIYPVTQAEWELLMKNQPSRFKGNPRFPVETVSYKDVEKFLQELNKKHGPDGYTYRLPTEQEWEYICRGGPISEFQSQYDFYFAKSKTDLTPNPTNDLSSEQAIFDGRYPAGSASKGPYLGTPRDVGSYLPNPLGIYDLHGNVWEWTSSPYSGGASGRVFRGGCWSANASSCTASYRSWFEPNLSDYNLGFRLLAVPTGQ